MMNYINKKIDWEKYIERRNSIFYVSIFNKAYGKMLLETTGFGFTHQLYTNEEGVYTFYKSGEELKKSDEYFLDLIKKKSFKIDRWYKNSLKYLKEEEKIVENFSHITAKEIIDNYGGTIDLLQDIFLYLTTIPMLILSSVDRAILGGDKKEYFDEIINMFEPFRRKSRNLLQVQVLEKIWKAAAERTGKEDYLHFSFFTVDEISRLFLGKNYPSDDEIAKRRKSCVIYENVSTNDLVFNYGPDFLKKIGIISPTIQSITELKGNTSYKGFVRGIAKIINKPGEMYKFQDGDIIVSVNTTPSLMPVLVKARGIVTDEGGLTCHASILCREIRIPCIVGTKYATKVLKDGDVIEVDAEKGVVRRL